MRWCEHDSTDLELYISLNQCACHMLYVRLPRLNRDAILLVVTTANKLPLKFVMVLLQWGDCCSPTNSESRLIDDSACQKSNVNVVINGQRIRGST